MVPFVLPNNHLAIRDFPFATEVFFILASFLVLLCFLCHVLVQVQERRSTTQICVYSFVFFPISVKEIWIPYIDNKLSSTHQLKMYPRSYQFTITQW
jgi:hypothetical protein